LACSGTTCRLVALGLITLGFGTTCRLLRKVQRDAIRRPRSVVASATHPTNQPALLQLGHPLSDDTLAALALLGELRLTWEAETVLVRIRGQRHQDGFPNGIADLLAPSP